ncbi:UNVERIFIED_CONTAM: hypothetical protein B566_EDAN019088, partial [Ephemera danica]
MTLFTLRILRVSAMGNKEKEAEATTLVMEYDNIAYIVGGDFNARIGEESILRGEVGEIHGEDITEQPRRSRDKIFNGEGKKLLEFCENMGLRILNGTHGRDKQGHFTYIGEGGASTIDFVLCSQNVLPLISDFSVEIRSESDHLPVVLQEALETVLERIQIYDNEDDRMQLRHLRKKFKMLRKSKIEEWKTRTISTITDILDTRDLTKIWNLLRRLRGSNFVNNNISEGEWTEHFKKVLGGDVELDTLFTVPDARVIHELDSAFLPEELEIAIKKLKNNKAPGIDGIPGEIFKLASNNTDEALETVLERIQIYDNEDDRMQLRHLRKKFKMLRKSKIEEWKTRTISTITDILDTRDLTKIWNLLRRLRGSNFVNNNISEGEWTEHFKKVLGGDVELDTLFTVPDARVIHELDSAFLPEELEIAIKKLKNNKAPGIDGIPGEIFKLASNNTDVFNSILHCCNTLYETGTYYSGWETSIIHTIYKNKGSVQSPDNYRGIALAPVMSKIYSSLLHSRLLTWALKNNKISSYQAGFRPGYSTIDNLFIMDHLVKKYLSRKKGKLFSVFVDFQKAFDTVNRKKLWEKLWDIGCSSRMLSALMA